MRHLLLITLVSFVVGCDSRVDVTPAGSSTLNGTWKVISYQDSGHQQIITSSSPESGLAPFPSGNILVTFQTHQDTLTLHGHTITNEVSGTFLLKTGDRLGVISFGGTKIGEPHWGSWFWNAMNSADLYHLSGDRLVIDYNQGEKSVVFKRQ